MQSSSPLWQSASSTAWSVASSTSCSSIGWKTSPRTLRSSCYATGWRSCAPYGPGGWTGRVANEVVRLTWRGAMEGAMAPRLAPRRASSGSKVASDLRERAPPGIRTQNLRSLRPQFVGVRICSKRPVVSGFFVQGRSLLLTAVSVL